MNHVGLHTRFLYFPNLMGPLKKPQEQAFHISSIYTIVTNQMYVHLWSHVLFYICKAWPLGAMFAMTAWILQYATCCYTILPKFWEVCLYMHINFNDILLSLMQ